MSTPDDNVSDGDRSRAKQIVEQARAEGRIIDFDRDKRIEQIEGAQSGAELRMITHDLDRSGPQSVVPPVFAQPMPQPMPQPTSQPIQQPPSTATPPAFTPTTVNYGPPTAASAEALAHVQAMTANPVGTVAKVGRRSCLGCLIPLVIAIVVIGAVGLAIFSSVRDSIDSVRDSFDSVQGATDSQTLAPGVEPANSSDINVFSGSGYAALVDAIEMQSGSTEVFSVVLYPTYAIVDVPADATTGREQSFYWNGVLDTFGTKGTTTDSRFDMLDFDPAIIVRLVKKVLAGVEDPTSWYAILQAPDSTGTAIRAFATNEFNETAYVFATKNGKVLDFAKPSEAP